jgi:hypothetical protein
MDPGTMPSDCATTESQNIPSEDECVAMLWNNWKKCKQAIDVPAQSLAIDQKNSADDL